MIYPNAAIMNFVALFLERFAYVTNYDLTTFSQNWHTVQSPVRCCYRPISNWVLLNVAYVRTISIDRPSGGPPATSGGGASKPLISAIADYALHDEPLAARHSHRPISASASIGSVRTNDHHRIGEIL